VSAPVPSGARRRTLVACRALNGALLALAPAQFYAAGLAAFGAADFTAHAAFGWGMILLGLLAALLGGAVPRGTGVRVTAALVAVLLVLQPVLAFVPRVALPALSAAHAANALAIVLLTLRVEQRLRVALGAGGGP
jgi:hypothetical protein